MELRISLSLGLCLSPPLPESPQGLATPPSTSSDSSPLGPLSSPSPGSVITDSFIYFPYEVGLHKKGLCLVLQFLACSKHRVKALKMFVNARNWVFVECLGHQSFVSIAGPGVGLSEANKGSPWETCVNRSGDAAWQVKNRSHEKTGSQGWGEADFQEPVCSMKSCGERCFLGSLGHRAFEEIEKQPLSILKGSQRMGKDSQAGGRWWVLSKASVGPSGWPWRKDPG